MLFSSLSLQIMQEFCVIAGDLKKKKVYSLGLFVPSVVCAFQASADSAARARTCYGVGMLGRPLLSANCNDWDRGKKKKS